MNIIHEPSNCYKRTSPEANEVTNFCYIHSQVTLKGLTLARANQLIISYGTTMEHLRERGGGAISIARQASKYFTKLIESKKEAATNDKKYN
jgi:hypothetical protein